MRPVHRFREQLRRPDWLAELQVVVVIGLVAAVGALVVNVVSLALRQPIVVAMPASAVEGLPGPADGLVAGASIASDSTVEVAVADPGVSDSLWYTARVLPELLLVVAVLALLLRLLMAARRDDPFTAAAVRRLRVLGAVSAVGGFLGGFLGTFAELVLSDRVSGGDVAQATLTISPVWLLVGGGFVAFAEIINRGRALRTELDTVI